MISSVMIPEKKKKKKNLFVLGVQLQKHPSLPQMTARWQKRQEDVLYWKQWKLKRAGDINVTSQLVFS